MKRLIAWNWKMAWNRSESVALVRSLCEIPGLPPSEKNEILLLPSFIALGEVGEAIAGVPGFLLGAQNFYPALRGAYTGEVGVDALRELGCAYVLVGHPERRARGESEPDIAAKIAFALEHELCVLLCVGETHEQRLADRVAATLTSQFTDALAQAPRVLSPERLTLAYLPTWGDSCATMLGTPEIIHAHGLLRSLLVETFAEAGWRMRIILGGARVQDIAAQALPLDNVDGLLLEDPSLEPAIIALIAALA